jgi:hypothetical protein
VNVASDGSTSCALVRCVGLLWTVCNNVFLELVNNTSWKKINPFRPNYGFDKSKLICVKNSDGDEVLWASTVYFKQDNYLLVPLLSQYENNQWSLIESPSVEDVIDSSVRVNKTHFAISKTTSSIWMFL